MSEEEEYVTVEEDGYAMIAGVRCSVVGIHMCGGGIGLRVLVPHGFPGCKDATITLFGHDDKGITQLPDLVDLEPVQGEFGLLDLKIVGFA